MLNRLSMIEEIAVKKDLVRQISSFQVHCSNEIIGINVIKRESVAEDPQR